MFLTSIQREIWFDQLLDIQNPKYNIGGYLIINGNIEPDILMQAIDIVIKNNDALRIIIDDENGIYRQTILRDADIKTVYHDFSYHKNPAKMAIDWLHQEFVKPFLLYNNLLFKFALLKISDNCHYLFGKYSHIIVDGFAISLIGKNIANAYNKSIDNQNLYSYIDFIQDEINYFSSKRYEKDKKFWNKIYSSCPDVLIPEKNTVKKSKKILLEINRNFYNQLIDFANIHSVSIFHIFLGVIYSYFIRIYQAKEIVVGIPILNRNSYNFRNTIGVFANVLPIRFNFNANLSFIDLIKDISKTLFKYYRHSRVPISEINKMAKIYQQNRKQLFDFEVSYEKFDFDICFNNIACETYTLSNEANQNPLALFIREYSSKQNVKIDFEYNLSALTDDEADSIKEHFEFLLQELLKNPDVSIKNLNIITEKEKSKLIQWNNTFINYPKDKTIIELFENQAEKTPEAAAVIFKDQQITYSELNKKSNQLAHYLISSGVKSETLIGISIHRSIEMIIAILGILKAGAAYVPIDNNYPKERILFMIGNAGIKTFFTQETIEKISIYPDNNPNIKVLSTNLAYIIYTSGSTGQPKGVMIEHGSVNTFIHWAKDVYSKDEISKVLACTSISFDLFIFETFVPLCWGGCLVLVENIMDLANLSGSENISLINTVPFAISKLNEMGLIPDSVKTINLAGEALKNELVQELYKKQSIKKIYNLYGPSEDTTYSTYTIVNKDETKKPSIGRPIANTQIYILDKYLNPMPIGAIGEICIAGDGLSRGYINRFDLTEEKFLNIKINGLTSKNPPAPFKKGGKPVRIYKTGDLGRFLPDGNIEYIGRIDNQIKLRGFRIELSEIEVYLSKHPYVKEAAAVLYPLNKNNIIAAYITVNNYNSDIIKKLQEHLKTFLPDYMVPSYFTIVDEMPLTPNGKIDKNALPKIDDIANKKDYEKPLTETEIKLAEIWQQVLNIKQIGIHDNFFELGGDSILIIQIAAKAKEVNLNIPPKDFFKHQTIYELSKIAKTINCKSQKENSIGNIYPLSHTQKGIFFHSIYDNDKDIYWEKFQCTFTGKLDPDIFQKSWQYLIDRHDILRTSLVDGNYETQVVNKGESPLIRRSLIKVFEDKYNFVFDYHHILMDGWSLSLLFKEFFETYIAFNQNKTPNLQQIRPFKDYILWQQSQDNTLAETFWQKKLKDFNTLRPIPIIMPLIEKFQYCDYKFNLSQKETEIIKKFSKKYHFTLNTLVLAAWSILMSRYLQEDDIVFGITVSGRDIDLFGIDKMIGLFINTLPFRIKTNSKKLDYFLSEIQREVFEINQHSHIFLGDIQKEKSPLPPFIKGGKALFDNIVVFENYPIENNTKIPFTIKDIETTEQTNYALTLSVMPDYILKFKLAYDKKRFLDDSIERLAKHFKTLLLSIEQNIESCIDNLSMLSGSELELIKSWSQIKKYYPKDKTIIDIFENQAAKNPCSIALVYQDKELSYFELNQKANKVAIYLIESGIKPDTLVGLMIDRSFEMIIGILGILKANGAYVPIDPNYPKSRIARILEDAKISILLTQKNIREILNNKNLSPNNPKSHVLPDNQAYIIYTSGSTGDPKGVLVTHHNVVRLFLSTQSYFNFNEKDVWTLFHSYSFDFSVWEIFGALLHGGKLIIVPYNVSRFSPYFHKLLSYNKVTVLNQTPLAFQQLIKYDSQIKEKLPLRLIIFGGEKLDIQSLKPWVEKYGYENPKLINMYGITETTVHVTYYPISKYCMENPKNIIGKPIPDLSINILDKYLNPVPIGITGEIFVGGAGLSKGYLNRADLTDEKFIEKPFRLYKTGDLARFLPDGNIEYIGRIDNQVKLRGFRIELSEIEANLLKHPDVCQAVVILDENIAAYVTLNNTKLNQDNILREHLSNLLPDYMIPALFVFLENMPLDSNGKIDRKSLPKPIFLPKSFDYEAPLTDVENKLAKIWQKILKIEKIGINDNFFELGGDSIISMQIVSKARDEKLYITPKDIFKCQTIKKLSEKVKIISEDNYSLDIIEENSSPLSPMQMGMLYHTFYEPDSSIYFEEFHCVITGDIDSHIFEKSWEYLIKRHDVFKTTFVLEKKPLMQFNLTKFSDDDEYKFVWRYHHIFLDGWSLPIIFKELLEIYKALKDGKDINLPKAISYKNYIYWLQRQDKDSAKTFWQNRIGDLDTSTQISIASKPKETSKYLEEILELNLIETDKIKGICRKNNLTINTFIQGAWAILLSRYSNHDDIVFGITISGRHISLPGIENMVGLFINTIPLRIKISPEKLILWLNEIQDENHENIKYSYISLLDIKNLTQLPKGSDLFESLIVFENYPLEDFFKQENNPFHVKDVYTIEQTNYALTLAIIPSNKLKFKLIYDSNRFAEIDIKRLISHLKNLLQNMCKDIEQLITSIPILDDFELNQFKLWNKTQADYLNDKTIVDFFEDRAEKNPNIDAVCDEGVLLKYKELNEKSNKLAHCLVNLNIKAETPVGVCIERSCELVTAILGVLKAKAAYLPIDSDYPSERIAFMVDDSKLSVILTQKKFENLFSRFKVKTLLIESDFDSYQSSNLKYKPLSKNLAYIIYTSGSTGMPKGVMIEHKSLTNLINWHCDFFKVKSSDRATLLASSAFDASIWELLPYLSKGACVLPVKSEILKSNSEFNFWLKKNKITISFIPTPLFESISIDEWSRHDSLRAVLIGGDKLHEYPSKQLPFDLFNNYGPTETTVAASSGIVRIHGHHFGHCLNQDGQDGQDVQDGLAQVKIDRHPGHTVNLGYPDSDNEKYEMDETMIMTSTDFKKMPEIGRPIANTQIYILDKFFNPVPIGAAGEIFIGGACLARGYLNRADLTDEKFLDIKINGITDNVKVFKTGDLAKFLSDGNIEFIGRIDNQIKLRGFRIELSEIEAAVLSNPLVKEASVLLNEDKKSIIAYVTVNSMQEEIPKILSQYLKNILPSYMIPSLFIVLDKIPLNTNGKIDKKALPKPFISNDLNYVEPENEIEKKLAHIWQKVLKIDLIGIYDNFFEMGADSILSIQVCSQARSQGFYISPKDIFIHQNIFELSKVIREKKNDENFKITGKVLLTPIQRWFFEQNLQEYGNYNQSVLFKIPDQIDFNILKQTLYEIIKHHDGLRLSFKEKNGEFEQWYNEEYQDIPITDKKISEQKTFNLEKCPLMIMSLFDLGEEKRLFWCIHHLIVDGVSWRILTEDFQRVYNQIEQKQSITFPPKTSSYKDWSEKLSNASDSKFFDNELEFWKNLPEKNFLPQDLNGENTFESVENYTVSLDKDYTFSLLKEVPKAYNARINDILLCALAQSIASWTNNKEILIDLESHGRADIFEDIDVSRTVGWFTSIFPVLLKSPFLKGDIENIKEQLQKIPNNGIGYGVLRYIAKKPLFNEPQILFNYLGQIDLNLSNNFFSYTEQSFEKNHTKIGKRNYLLEINSFIKDGNLCLVWSYSKNIYHHNTIKNLADSYIVNLEKIVSKISVGEIEDTYPLSPIQEGMLFHSLYNTDENIYFEEWHCKICGELNTDIFQKSWQYLIDRHPVLRTYILWETNKKPLQAVNKKVILSWSDSYEEKNKQIDIFKPPLMRFSLIKLDDEKYQFIWHYHHILFDGWCLSIIFKELLEIYTSFVQKKNPLLPQSRPFKDYITWLEKQDILPAKNFWTEKLNGFHSITRISQKSVLKEKHNFSQHDFSIDEIETKKLKIFAAKHRLTLNTLIQGAWAVLLSRYSQEDDVVFGVTVSGRHIDMEGIENMLGLFINTITFRFKVNYNNLITWFCDIQKTMQDCMQYSYISLLDIQNSSQIPKGINLFESLLIFENYPSMDIKKLKAPFKISDIQTYEKTNYPLTIAVIPNDYLSFKIVYDSNSFDKYFIENLILYFKNLLLSIPENFIFNNFEIDQLKSWNNTQFDGHDHHFGHCLNQDGQDVQDLQDGLMAQVKIDRHPGHPVNLRYPDSDNEKYEMDEKMIMTQFDYDKNKTIVDIFEDYALKMPDSIAVCDDKNCLSYFELNQKANKLAHYLIALGVSNNTLVGVHQHRSTDIIVCFLGILKAGGAYLPIDPYYPIEHIDYMINDADIKFLLTKDNINNNNLNSYLSDNPIRQANPNNLAYVIYTSGTTGRPKGVMVEHKGLYNLVMAQKQIFDINHKSRVLQFSSSSFDASIWEFVMALCNGASLYIYSQKMFFSYYDLVEYLEKFNITHATIPPSVLSLLPLENNNIKLKTLIVAGEACPLELADKWSKDRNFFNAYGPTEYSVCASAYKYSGSEKTLPIGKPIINTQIYILDKNFNNMPIGAVGEIFLSGDGLARGYINKADLTDEKFLSIPINKEPVLVYRTGDLGRYLADGNIEFLGRIDNQVKLRGFRIELEEIEQVINKFNYVEKSVVILYGEENNKQLCAYIILKNYYNKPNNEQIIASLKQYLKDILPNYMIPSYITVINEMPLTINAKVDRKALPKPKHYNTLKDNKNHSLTEELLIEICKDVLKTDNISIYDNFFESGGHSLSATQFSSRIRECFAVDMEIKNVFENPILKDLALLIDKTKKKPEYFNIKPSKQQKDKIELSYAQQRLWFLNQIENCNYNIPLAFSLKGEIDVNILKKSLHYLTQRHESLCMRFLSEDGKPYISLIKAYNPLTFISLSDLKSFIKEPFNLEDGKLLRAALIKLSSKDHILLFNMHHIISDGWSMAIFIKEISHVYESYLKNKKIRLHRLSVKYSDFSYWQKEFFNENESIITSQLNYWENQLKDYPVLLELPTDRKRPAIQTYNGANIKINFSNELFKKLQLFCKNNGITLFMALLSAFKVLLYRYTDKSDICVGSPIANRNRGSKIENLIGFFVNTLVLRTQINKDENFIYLTKNIRKTCLDAYTNQDLPFEQLVNKLKIERNLSHSPLFQVMFILQNNFTQDINLSNITVTPIDIDNQISTFDLTLSLEEYNKELKGVFEYNTDLFDADTIKRLSDNFLVLIEEILKNPEKPVKKLSILTDFELKQLESWNNTKTFYPKDQTIVDLFEEQAEKNPDKTAIAYKNDKITYFELNQKSNKIAHYLMSSGVKPETLIGISQERSFDMIASILGVLKAGAAYIPIDLNYPKERISFMIKDAKISTVLTCDKVKQIDSYPSYNPENKLLLNNLAYLIYTSGTTGYPKGVMIEHKNILNAYYAWNEAYNLKSVKTHLQMANFTFDVFTGDLVRSLCSGAKLVLNPDEYLFDAEKLFNLIQNEQIEFLEFVPAVLRNLIKYLEISNNRLDFIKILCCGSDVWNMGEYRKIKKFLGNNTRLINSYGLTEATVDSTYFEESLINLSDDDIVPIGKPFANTNCFILDSNLTCVPIGAVGELYLSGDGIARGYLNSSNLYRTGDLAKFLSDGNIKLIGRTDNQIKIRGVRIELSEIESVLMRHPSVKEAAVLAVENSDGNKILLAYIVFNLGLELLHHVLREYLKQQLPQYMIPNDFIIVDSLPLTQSGKIDRNLLVRPNKILKTDKYSIPRNNVELQLVRIWEEVLNMQSVGIFDNFFESGGHSLLALQLISLIKNCFNKSVPVTALFQNPTISELSLFLRKNDELKTFSSIVPIQPKGTKNPFFCAPGAGGYVFYLNALARNMGIDQPFYALQDPGLMNDFEPYNKIPDLAEFHIKNIRQIKNKGPYFLGGHSFGGFLAFEIAQKLKKQGDEISKLIIFDTFVPAGNQNISENNFDDIEWLISAVKVIEDMSGKNLDINNWQQIELLSETKRLEYIFEKFKKNQVFSLDEDYDKFTKIFNVYKSNCISQNNYKPDDLYPIPITLFRSNESKLHDVIDNDMGWGKYSDGDVEVHYVSGGHINMLTDIVIADYINELMVKKRQP